MRLKVFAIYDKATEHFNQPFFMLTRAEAIRAFQNMAKDDQTQIYQNPLDYELYELASWENSDGKFEETLDNLGSASLFKEKAEQENITPLKKVTQ